MSIDRNSSEYSNQEIIEKVRAIIDFEESKPLAERDVDLITECVDYLMELEQGVELSQEEIEKEKQKIYKYNQELNQPKKKHHFKGLLIAACFVALMLAANFAAMAYGVDTISILKEWGHRIVEMFEGEEAEYKGITIIKEQQPLVFTSMDDFLAETNFPILYPSSFPLDINVDVITVSGSYDNNYKYTSEYNRIMFSTNNSQISLIVDTYPGSSKDFLNDKNLQIQTINGYECYLNNVNKNIECSFVHNNISYFISSNDYNNLVIIISNLKEVLK